MASNQDIGSMARALGEGFTAAQDARFHETFCAAKIAAVVVLSGQYGVGQANTLDALRHNKNLEAALERLVARIEDSPECVRYIHSGIDF